jgi:hypothetical protein
MVGATSYDWSKLIVNPGTPFLYQEHANSQAKLSSLYHRAQ